MYIAHASQHFQSTRKLGRKRSCDRWDINYMRLYCDFFSLFVFFFNFYLDNKKWSNESSDGEAQKSIMYPHMNGRDELWVFNPITCHMFDAIRTNINISFQHAKRISVASGIEDYQLPWSFPLHIFLYNVLELFLIRFAKAVKFKFECKCKSPIDFHFNFQFYFHFREIWKIWMVKFSRDYIYPVFTTQRRSKRTMERIVGRIGIVPIDSYLSYSYNDSNR